MTLERVDSPLAGRRPGSLGPVGGVGALGGQAPSGAAIAPPLTERSGAPFWQDLKGIERWFDTLDSGERVTLMASLFSRSSETQLRQFSAAIDKSAKTAQHAPATPAQTAFASNLSRFGMGQPAVAPPQDFSSLRYRAPLQKQTSGSGNPASLTAGPGGPPQGSAAAGVGATGSSGSGSSAPAGSVAPVAPGSASAGYMWPLNGPLSAPLSSTQNAFSASSDLYVQAFLPLPRSKSYTPWGPDIRPKSATADTWPDLPSGRASPQPAQSSPNLAALSLEQSASSTSPIGHPIKPWRTFTPAGLGQAPDSFDLTRAQRQSPAQSTGLLSGPASGSPSNGLPVLGGSAAGNSALGSKPPPLQGSASSVGHHSSVPHLPLDFSTRAAGVGGVPASKAVPVPAPGNQSPTSAGSLPSEPTAGSASSSKSSLGRFASDGSTSPSGAADSISPSKSFYAAPLPQAASSAAMKQLPKRGVNVVDVELLSDIGAWLRSLRLHKYTGNLAGMRWQDVVLLEDADLESRGVNALGARRKLLKMFEEIRQAQEAGLLPEEDV